MKKYEDDSYEEWIGVRHTPDHKAHYYHPSHDRLPPSYTFGCLGPFVVLVIAAFALYRLFCAPEYNPAERYQQRPEDSIRYYLKTVDDYLHGDRGVYARDVMFCVTSDDVWWFEHHSQGILSSRRDDAKMPVKGEKAVPPAELALRVLLNRGPIDSNGEVVLTQPGATMAKCTVKYMVSPEPGLTSKAPIEKKFDVELKLEKGLWKVVGFAGARKFFQ